MRILVVNTGSSSLKLDVLGIPTAAAADADSTGDPGATVGADADADGGGPGRRVSGWDGHDLQPLADLVDEAGDVDAVGHRVVHGGPDLATAVLIDDDVVERLRALAPLAPLHQERALAGIAAARQVLPDVPHVACFDTAHHATLPPAAATYALPAAWRERWPLRRFGFHGLSHSYAARRAAELVGVLPGAGGGLRVVTCHLGSGASLCASRDGRSVDTTMGFTPLEGLVMGTRAGTVDPGLVLWLITEAGLPAGEVQGGLEHASGLAGLAGTSDMAEVLDRCRAGDEAARLALDVYVHVLAREVGAMTASLGGLDVLVFTGGVGEHAPQVRAEAAARLPHLGVALDPARNAVATGSGDSDVSSPGTGVTTLVVTAREDLEIARQTHATLARRP